MSSIVKAFSGRRLGSTGPITMTSSIRAYTNHIRDSKGTFSERERAIEEQFIRKHEQEVTKKLKEDVLAKENAPKPAPSAEKSGLAEDEKIIFTPIDSSAGGAVRGAGGTMGKREAVAEEQYFRDRNKETAAHLKDELLKK